MVMKMMVLSEEPDEVSKLTHVVDIKMLKIVS